MTKPRRIWSKFFWSDWQSDPALRVCSLAAQGLWMRLLCVAAEADPIGYVTINGRSLGNADIARLAGVTEAECEALLLELDQNGVFSRTRNKTIYSRRMVRDAKRAENAQKNGKKGGNPNLCKNKRNSDWDNPPDKPPDNTQKPEARIQKEAAASSSEATVAPRDRPPDRPPDGTELDAIEAALRQAAGLENDPSPGLLVLAPILGLIDAGLDLDRDILPAIRGVARSNRKGRTWGYYVHAINDFRAQRGGAEAVASASPSPAKLSPEDTWIRAQNALEYQWLTTGMAPTRSVKPHTVSDDHLAKWLELNAERLKRRPEPATPRQPQEDAA